MPLVFEESHTLIASLAAINGGIILVDGNLGAGKTFFADQASVILGRTVIHLDDARDGEAEGVFDPCVRDVLLDGLADQARPDSIIEGVCARHLFSTMQERRRPDLAISGHVFVRAWYPLLGGRSWRDPVDGFGGISQIVFDYWTMENPASKADFIFARETAVSD